MKRTDKFFSIIGGLSLAVVFIVVFAQVLCRYIFKLSLPWGTDVTRIAFVVSIFAGMLIGVIRNCHLNIDVFVHILPVGAQKVAAFITNVIVFIFLAVVAWFSIPFILNNTDQYMPYFDWLPMSYVYAVIPVTVVFMLVALVIDTYRLLTGRN